MKQGSSRLTDLLSLGVFALFALCLLGVLLTGAGVYQRLTEAGDARYQRQTAAQYLATRVRQADTVQLEDFEGQPALVFPDEVEGLPCVTRVYWYEGALRELFSLADAALSPEDGEVILETAPPQFALEEGLLRVELEGRTLLLTLRSERQVAP